MSATANYIITTVKYEIERIFGRKIITSRDCIELNDDIFMTTKEQLNVNTLRRFFGLIKAPYPPCQSTLTILSKYCGFKSTDDIYKVRNTISFEKGVLDPNTVLHFFVSLFRDNVVSMNMSDPFLNMVTHSIHFLNANKFLAARFQKSIAATENGQRFYFEQMVNVDELNGYYGDGLCDYEKCCSTIESKIFASSLYIFRAWLTGNGAALIKNAATIEHYQPTENLDPIINCRRLAALLFCKEGTAIDNDQIRIDIHNSYIDLLSLPNKHSCISKFVSIVSEALLLTNYPGDALYYLEQSKKMQVSGQIANMSLDQLHSDMLLEAHALMDLKFIKKAAVVFEKIKSSVFPFLAKNFCAILYLSLFKKISSNAKSIKYENQFYYLIQKTGFKRLSQLWQVREAIDGKMD